MPKRLPYIDYEGRYCDYIATFLSDEYLAFPVSIHDDMLDCRARILDEKLGAEFPRAAPKPEAVNSYEYGMSSSGWMG